MTYTLGIDVGTTFTAAATWSDGVAAVLPLSALSDSIETVLCRKGADWLVGDDALRWAAVHPESVARGFKRRMGDSVPIRVAGADVQPEELTARVIEHVVGVARERFGEPPSIVCLTHPAAWGGYRLERMQQAAALAGIPSAAVTVAPEPIAAACYYSLRDRLPDGALLAVYDFGGGTFDAGLVRKSGTGFEFVGESVGIDVGGLDVDEVLMGYVGSLCGPDWAAVDRDDPDLRRALAALRGEIVQAKEALSDDVETSIQVALPGLNRSVRVTRRDLEGLADDFIDQTVATFSSLLERNRVRTTDVNGTLLVGGSSRMPAVAERLAGALGLDVRVDAHPKFAVCLGAAALAAAGSDGAAALAARGSGAPAPDGALGAGIGATEAGRGGSEASDQRRPAASAASSAGSSKGPAPTMAAAPHHPPVSVALVADLVRAGLQQSSPKAPAPARRPVPGSSANRVPAQPVPPTTAPPRRPVPAPSPGSVTEFRTRDHPTEARPRWPLIVVALVLLVLTGVLVTSLVLSR
jgi:molecular chaperone DnaK